MKRLLVAFLVLAAVSGGSSAQSGALPGAGFRKEAFIASSSTGVVLRVALVDCIAWTVRANPDVMIRKLDPLIAGKDVEAATEAFGPTADAAVSVADERQAVPLPFSASTNTDSRAGELRVGISGRMRTGGRYAAEVLGRRVDESPVRTGVSPRYEAGPVLTVTQPLFRGAGREVTEAEIAIAVKGQEAARLAVREALMDAVTQTKVAYYAHAVSIEGYRIESEALARVESLQRINKERFAKGIISSVDLLETDAAVAQRRKSLISAESGLRRTEDGLKQLTNLIDDPSLWNARLELLDALKAEECRFDLQESLVRAFVNRPDFASKRAEIAAQDIRVMMAKDAAHPTIDLFGSFGLNGIGADVGEAFGNADLDSRAWSAGVRVTVPLPGAEKSTYDKRKLERARRLLELKRLEQRIVLEVRDKVREVDVARREMDAAAVLLDKEHQNYMAQKERYRAGQVSTHDMIDYENRLFEAEFGSQRAMFDYLSAVANAEKAEATTLIRNRITVED